MTKRKRELVAFVVCLYACCCILYYIVSLYPYGIFKNKSYSLDLEPADKISVSLHSRRLLNFFSTLAPSMPIISNDSNCTRPDIEQFPRPLMDYETRRKGGLVVHIFVTLYMFLGLAIICDEYFVPSLEKMCKLLKMQPDVAGATFMAAGSSAPELATALIAVFIAKDDIGIGTVVGSAVFNIAFVVGITGLFAGRIIYLNWWPMFRDCTFYLISILALLFALQDETVTWIESVLFLSLYVVYIIFMFINHRVETWISSLKCLSNVAPYTSQPSNGTTYHPLPDMMLEISERSTSDKQLQSSDSEFLSSTESFQIPEGEEESNIFAPPSGFFHRVLWLTSLPLLAVCFITVPDCRRKRWEKWFFVTFFSSCLWIGLLSYILVWMITIIGYTLHIKDTIMGLTFLAAGASIPDAISSLLVARNGFGDMAVSNAVGSNVFDILLCLGLPWFIQTALAEPGSTITVKSHGLTYSTLSLLLTVIFLLVATHLNGWKLNKRYGLILLIWYALFMVLASLYESDLLGFSSLPTCPSDF